MQQTVSFETKSHLVDRQFARALYQLDKGAEKVTCLIEKSACPGQTEQALIALLFSLAK